MRALHGLEYLILEGYASIQLSGNEYKDYDTLSYCLKKLAINNSSIGGHYEDEDIQEEIYLKMQEAAVEFDSDGEEVGNKDEDKGAAERRRDEYVTIDPYINDDTNIFDYIERQCPNYQNLF